MIAVIIAGGSGTRLWPLSTSDYPKHLLRLTNDKSLLRNTYERAKLVADNIYVISEASHISHVYEQLSELPRENFIVEPGRRGTASCVIMALSKIKPKHTADEPVVFMHADHHIRDVTGFSESLILAGEFASQHQKIVLLGLEPTHPATGFGYIERGRHADGGRVYNVASFKEKPDHETAEQYLASGKYLWNMGYFVATVTVFERSLRTSAPNLWNNYQKLLATRKEAELTDHYLAFSNEAIDTALIEKVNELLVTPGTFDWMDVGSFSDVHLVNKQDNDGNTLQGRVATENVTNSLVRNDGDTPVAVIGLDNVAVISTPQGILVINKSYSQKVGDVAKRLQ